MREEKEGGKLFFSSHFFLDKSAPRLFHSRFFFLLPRTSQRGKFCVRTYVNILPRLSYSSPSSPVASPIITFITKQDALSLSQPRRTHAKTPPSLTFI